VLSGLTLKASEKKQRANLQFEEMPVQAEVEKAVALRTGIREYSWLLILRLGFAEQVAQPLQTLPLSARG
jgi:hypothetical protein